MEDENDQIDSTEEFAEEPELQDPGKGPLGPGIHFDISEEEYHNDPCGAPSLSVSIAQDLVLRSPAHAYLRHPLLGGQRRKPTKEMDRGTLIHALLLGRGKEIAVVECTDWRKKANQELREQFQAEGKVVFTRPQYQSALDAAMALREKLAARGYVFDGHSEVTLIWDEQTSAGRVVRCRGRVDHLKLDANFGEVLDLKITGDANPRTITRGHLTSMGYDIQGVVYPSALELLRPELTARTSMTLLFCEPEPPYCVTPIVLRQSMRALGKTKWRHAKKRWVRCLATNTWPDYVPSGVAYAEAKPWEIEEASALEIEDTPSLAQAV